MVIVKSKTMLETPKGITTEKLYLCIGRQPERYKLMETHSKRGGLKAG